MKKTQVLFPLTIKSTPVAIQAASLRTLNYATVENNENVGALFG